METKLTLRLNDKVIKSAKIYAKKHDSSVSKIVSNYLSTLTEEETDFPLSAVVEEISGIIPQDVDLKAIINDYGVKMQEKHT